MDLPYSHQQQTRRKNRSSGTLHELSLSPVTTRLPSNDDGFYDVRSSKLYAYGSASVPLSPAQPTSYLAGKSAPTTPRLLSKSPPPLSGKHPLSRSQSHDGRPSLARLRSLQAESGHKHRRGLSKSLSTTHLSHHQQHHQHHHHHHHNNSNRSKNASTQWDGLADRTSNNDWLFRTGALMASETRESKGQSWLTARASSTSLTGLRDATEAEDVAAFEQQLVHEREELVGSSLPSALSPNKLLFRGPGSGLPSRVHSHAGSRMGSRIGSRMGSRAHSRVSSGRMQFFTPMTALSVEENNSSSNNNNNNLLATSSPHGGYASSSTGGYFDTIDPADFAGYAVVAGEGEGDDEDHTDGPDFVGLDAKLEAFDQDTSLADEDHVRRLVRRQRADGVMGSWFWSFFSADVNDDVDGEEDAESSDGGDEYDEDEEYDDDNNDEHRQRRNKIVRRFEGIANVPEERMPPPPQADQGTWQDAAWLLSVATKVIL